MRFNQISPHRDYIPFYCTLHFFFNSYRHGKGRKKKKMKRTSKETHCHALFDVLLAKNMVSTDESFNFYGCYLSRTTPRTSIHFQDPAGGGVLPGEVKTKIDWLIGFWLCLFLSLVTALLMAIANNNEPEEHGTFLLKISRHVSSSIEYVIKNICTVWSKQVSFFLGIFRYKVKHDQTKASWIRYLEMNFVEVATASRKCSGVLKISPATSFSCNVVSRFKAIVHCLNLIFSNAKVCNLFGSKSRGKAIHGHPS